MIAPEPFRIGRAVRPGDEVVIALNIVCPEDEIEVTPFFRLVHSSHIEFGDKNFLTIKFEKPPKPEPKPAEEPSLPFPPHKVEEFNLELAQSMIQSQIMISKFEDNDKDLNDSIEIKSEDEDQFEDAKSSHEVPSLVEEKDISPKIEKMDEKECSPKFKDEPPQSLNVGNHPKESNVLIMNVPPQNPSEILVDEFSKIDINPSFKPPVQEQAPVVPQEVPVSQPSFHPPPTNLLQPQQHVAQPAPSQPISAPMPVAENPYTYPSIPVQAPRPEAPSMPVMSQPQQPPKPLVSSFVASSYTNEEDLMKIKYCDKVQLLYNDKKLSIHVDNMMELVSMGFTDYDKNLNMLRIYCNNLNKVIDNLIQ